METPGSSALFEELIGQVTPRVSSFPHLILQDGPESFWCAARLAGIVPGWWGNWPIYNADGSPFTGSDEVAALRAWGEEPNQQWLLQRKRFAKLGHLAFFVNANLPSDIVAETYQRLDRSALPWFNNVWPIIADLIEALNWVYIPLSDEHPLALLVVARGNSHWIDRLKQQSSEKGIFSTRVLEENAMDTWRIPENM